MASKLLLRILTAARPGIQAGKLKMQDIVSEYFKQTGGKTIDPGERAIIENEFIEFAPSNVTTPDAFKGFLNEGEIVNQSSTASRGPNVQKASEMSDTPFSDKVMKDRDVTLRGDETFGELTEKFGKSTDKGIGSMIPKEYYGYNRGKGGEYTKIPSPVYWDDLKAVDQPLDTSRIKNWSQRDDYAKFIRKMRDKDFENKDIRKLVKDSGGDVAEGKRAATSLARAAEMVADTKVKQEVLSDLDEMKLDKGPRWWKGDDKYDNIEGPMGAGTRGDMTKRLNDKVYYAVMDDLDNILGEEKSYEVLKPLGGFGNRSAYNNDPDAFVKAIKEELEFSDVKYDMTFWENYVDEIMQLTTPEIPMFKYGGLV
jgi:DNA-binding transcriptional MerR regulator